MKHLFRFTWEKLSFAVIVILVLKSWFFGSFIDEQEHAAAGWLISQGWVMYRDFFLHHTPLPHYLSSLFFLAGQPPWWLWRAITLGYALVIGKLVWRRAHLKFRPSLLLTGVLLAVAVPKLNLQMFLADSFLTLSFLGSLILLASYWQSRQPDFGFVLKWLLFFFFVSGWSTIAAVPLFLLLLTGLFVTEYRRQKKWQTVWLISKKPILWFLFSVSIFPLYFFLSGAWQDFWWSAVTYNQRYYFPIHLAETAAERQGGALYYAYTRLAELLLTQGKLIIQTAFAFLLTCKGLVAAIGTISVSQFLQLVKVWLVTPVTTLASDAHTVLAVGWWFLAAIFVWRRQWQNLLLLLAGSGLLFIRNNEIFHLSVFFAVLFWVASTLWMDSLRHRRFGQGAVLGFFLLIALVHFGQDYLKHLEDRPPMVTSEQQRVARLISEQSQAGERLQVTGGSLTYYLLAERLPAGKTILYYAWFSSAGNIRRDLMQTLENQQADIVLLEEQDAIENGTYFDPELVKILQTYYSEGEQGIYLPKISNETQP